MRIRNRLTIALLLVFGSVVVAEAGGDAAAGKVKSAPCMACHGPDGNSPAPMFPKIAGQDANYIVRQIDAFQSGARVDPLMTAQAANLNSTDIADLAAYFSSQRPNAGQPGDPKQMAAGEQLYRKGRFGSFVIACVGCHGLNGEGSLSVQAIIGETTAVNAPRLGGQHATYIEKQLKAFRGGERKTDVAAIMQRIAAGMTDDEITAVATFIGSLN